MWRPPANTRETAEFLKARRNEEGLSRQEAADLMCINERNYAQYEDGVRPLARATFIVAMSVCKVLEINPDDMVFKCARDGMLDECLDEMM